MAAQSGDVTGNGYDIVNAGEFRPAGERAPAGNGLYPALPGWDYVTGLGGPRVSGLICDLTHRC